MVPALTHIVVVLGRKRRLEALLQKAQQVVSPNSEPASPLDLLPHHASPSPDNAQQPQDVFMVAGGTKRTARGDNGTVEQDWKNPLLDHAEHLVQMLPASRTDALILGKVEVRIDLDQ